MNGPLRLLVFTTLLACAPQVAWAADCASLPLVNVHEARAALWQQQQPKTVEEVQALSEIARQWESVTRKRVVDCVQDGLKANGHTPAKPSGTPAHAEGSAGLLTDIDDAYDSLAAAEDAAQRFEAMGYTVTWDTPNSFSVKEIDYVGFSMEEPVYAPGSPEANSALRRAVANEDNVKTIGGQQWVKGKVQPKARIDELNGEKSRILEQLESGQTGDQTEAALRQRVAEMDDEIAGLRKAIAEAEINDPLGFNTDMMKKGTHHMNPAEWCPPHQAYNCYEQPRQSAKAAHRVLSETLENPTPEQQALLKRLDDFAKKRDILPSEAEAYAAAEAQLKSDIRSAFKQANEQALLKESTLNEELVEKFRKAQETGDKKALQEVSEAMAERREASRRIQMTMEELTKDPHLPHAGQTIHEWQTGQTLRRIERPGKPPIYAVVEETSEGLKVTKTLTEAEVQRTAKTLITKNAIRSQYHGNPFQTRPQFSTFTPRSKVGQLAVDAEYAAKDLWRQHGILGILGTAYAAYTGTEQSVALVNRYTKLKVLSWSKIKAGDVSAEDIAGWALATGLGTVIGVAEVTGVTLIGMADDIGASLYGLARQRELDQAQQQGREASKFGVLANLLNPAALAQQFAKESARWAKDWITQTATDVDAEVRAELEAIEAELAAGRAERALWARLKNGGFEQMLEGVVQLRERTDLLRQAWRSSTDAIDRAILAHDDFELLMGRAEQAPDFAGQCQGLLGGLGSDPTPDAVRAARQQWSDATGAYAEALRKAALSGFEVRAAAVMAEGVLASGDGLAALQQAQAQLQADLAGRFGRLITAVGEDSVLVRLRDEVNALANPVPFDQAPGLLQAARDARSEAENRLVTLASLDQTALPPCPFPEVLDAVGLQAAVAEAQSALQACDAARIGTSRMILTGYEGRLSEDGHTLLATLGREANASTAMTQAREVYAAGDLAAARAALGQAKQSDCPARRAEAEAALEKVERMAGVMSQIEAARSACELGRITSFAEQLADKPHTLLVQAKASLDGMTAPLAQALDKAAQSKPAYLSGRLGEAEALLVAARGDLDTIGGEACPALRQSIAERLDKIGRLRSALTRAEQARQSCDLDGMQAFVAQVSASSHALLRQKGETLRQAMPSCEAQEQREAERTQEQDQQRRTQARDEACATVYDGGVVVERLADGGFHCGCPAGLYLHEGFAACLTWTEVVMNAERICGADGGSLARLGGPDDYSCCPAGKSYDEATDACWGEADLQADARAECATDGSIPVQINGPGDYVCCPRSLPLYDPATNTCRAEHYAVEPEPEPDWQDSEEALRQQEELERGLMDLMRSMNSGQGQGGGYSGGGYAGGGTSGGGYGGSTGGTSSTACSGFEAEANQHAARIQSLSQQYQANPGNRALACEIFREGQRGQQIMSRAQANGCPVPPMATQYQGAFSNALGANCS